MLVLFGVLSSELVRGTVFFGELGLDGSVRPVPGAVNAAESRPGPVAGRGSSWRPKSLRRPPRSRVSRSSRRAAWWSSWSTLLGRTLIAPTSTRAKLEAPPAAVDLSVIQGRNPARRARGRGGQAPQPAFHRAAGVRQDTLGACAAGDPAAADARRVARGDAYPRISGIIGRRGLVQTPPFRAPHATASEAALVGGGSPPMPGEVSLAHRGVLFLDEAAEFRRASLDALRAPIEDRHVMVARARRSVQFPSAVMLVLAMNPCSCGGALRRLSPTLSLHARAGARLSAAPVRAAARPHRHAHLAAASADGRPRRAGSCADLGRRPSPGSSRPSALQYERNRAASRRPHGVDAVPNADLDIETLERVAGLAPAEARFLARAGSSLRHLGASLAPDPAGRAHHRRPRGQRAHRERAPGRGGLVPTSAGARLSQRRRRGQRVRGLTRPTRVRPDEGGPHTHQSWRAREGFPSAMSGRPSTAGGSASRGGPSISMEKWQW